MATTAESGLRDAWLADTKRWRIPRPKMTTSRDSQQQQQQCRPADPPQDYFSDSDQEATITNLSSNEGSPARSDDSSSS